MSGIISQRQGGIGNPMWPVVKHLFSSRRTVPGPWAVGRGLRPWLLASFLLAALSFQAALAAAAGQDAPPGVRRAHMDILYSSSLFRTVSKNDAIAAMRVWVDTVGRQKGYLLDCNVTVAEDLTELKRDVQKGPAGLVLLDPVEYFELEGLGLLEPAFGGTRGKENERLQFLLVANRESGVTTISGLRGKTLAIQSESRAELGRKWIEVLLHEDGLGPADRFFSSVISAVAPSAAVLPVFFGKVGAGVVDRASFEVMKEMNPQLGSRLRVLAVSSPLLSGILCVDKRHIEYREDLIRILGELDQTTAGQQILMVFKSDKLTRWALMNWSE
jgi:phosphonate transport system substrate-binding protein